ncbi:hypothetical protein MBRA1_000027 [Malassezia brasiliensis]|uniref:Uncharacterized protein n=1 Tax=Malassezia brasiliensis TaxID=1821822 RepID=A0AAF0IM09_9BASI|nr:hypothetical protein MBRA1_000027 [Malassezia brasiliensis]
MTSRQRKAQRSLQVAYEARLPPNARRFPWPDRVGLITAQEGLDEVLFSEAKAFRANDEYERAFLKHLVARTEHAISDATPDEEHAIPMPRQDWSVNEGILERYVELVSLPTTEDTNEGLVGAPVPQPMYSRHFFPCADGDVDPVLGPSASVTLREEGVAISQGTTGLKTWEASYRLAAYLVAEQASWRSQAQSVVELGSGAGFLGMVCARILRGTDSRVLLTDIAGNVLERLQETAHLSMSTENSLLRKANATRVLAADVVYDPELIAPFVNALRMALAGSEDASRYPADPVWDDNIPYALVASTVRNPATYEAFLDRLTAEKLRWKKVEIPTPMWPGSEEGSLLPLFPSTHDPEIGGTCLARTVFAA